MKNLAYHTLLTDERWLYYQLKGSVQAGPKRRFCSDFPSCSESAEICHVDSLCSKNVAVVFFFQEGKKYGQNCSNSPSPPPLSLSLSLCLSPNNVGFRSLRTKTLLDGGGGLSRTCLKPCFPACGKKKHRDIFSQKKSRHGKFQRILSNLENRYKIATWGWLARTLHHLYISF